MNRVRRVITAHDDQGLSIFKNVSEVDPILGRATNIWGIWGWDQGSDQIPVDQPEDYPYKSMFPPVGGVRVQMIAHPPHGSADVDPYDDGPTAADTRIMELVEAGDRLHERVGRLHSTNSVDISFIISGEIEFLQDGGQSITLVPGDCIVVNGTNHKWLNHADVACVMGSVMLGARRGPDAGR